MYNTDQPAMMLKFVNQSFRNDWPTSEDERSMSTLRVLKDRYTGKATGQTIDLTYSHETGKFETIDNVFQEEF